MKRYSLLRNNRESGPYTLRELKSLGLTTTDLIWIEGESLAWVYPTEIDELQPIAAKGILVPLASEPVEVSNQGMQSLPMDPANFSQSSVANKPINTSEDYSIYLEEKEKPIEWKPKQKKRSLAEVSSGFFGLGVLLIGVMMCAFVVKKLVEQFDIAQPLFSAEAIEISKETLPVSASSNMAKTVQVNTASAFPLSTTEQAPVEVITSSITKPVVTKKEPVDIKETIETTDKPATAEEVKTASQNDVVKEESVPEKQEEKPTERIVKKAPSLSISANEYKVGVFGGISEFELAISNPSSVNVDKAIVEVEYLKPNGSVVKSQTLSVENISAGGAKKIQVPASSRGVKVRYRIVSVNAADEKIAAANS